MASAKKVTIAGAGIFGLSCAWALLQRGAQVVVYESRHIGAGSSGGTMGALAPHVPEDWNDKKQVQLEALTLAPDWWDGVAQASGLDPAYRRSGRIQPMTAKSLPRIKDRIEAARHNWPAWAKIEIQDSPDVALIPQSADGLWLFDNMAAHIKPRLALKALAAAVRSKGGQIIEGQPVPDDPQPPIIWATGVEGLTPFNGNGVKGQSALLRFDAVGSPQAFVEALHFVPHIDGTVAVGSTSERDTPDCGTDELLEELVAKARILCPALADAPVIDRWAGQRPRALTRAPMVGPWPGRPGHFIANGGFKIGFAMAPAVGIMLADLILDGRDAVPPLFRPPTPVI